MGSDNELEFPHNQSRTPHPLKGTIRKTPPTTISADTAVVVKKQKTTSPGQSKNRIHVGDFDQMTKSLTECYDFRRLDNRRQSKDQEFSSMSCSRMQVC